MSGILQRIERTIPASQFKTHCLALLDEVADSGVAIVVTKRGKPMARLAPIEPPPSLRGSVTYHVSDEELIAPLWEDWDPELP